MTKKLLLITLGFSLAVGGFWAGNAQDPMPQKPTTPKTEVPTVATQTVQTDLSGTYIGTFNCDVLGLTGDTTLTITGNEFTTADGKKGRIVASTTHGYTAVALQLEDTAAATTMPAAPTTPTIISLRAKKSGNRLMLMPVSGGTAMKCSFVPGRNVARGKRNQRTPAATGTEVSNPAAVPAPVPAESPMPMPSQTPSPSPSPTATPSPEPSPTPSPEPMPSPTPSGSPQPQPSPSPGEPTPTPTPNPSPSPSPSPSPRPGM